MSKKTPEKTAEPEHARLIVAATSTGKQGKSTTMGHIVDWFRTRHADMPLAVFDPDDVHRTLYRKFGPQGLAAFTPDEPHKISCLDISGGEGFVKFDEVLNAFGDADVVLVDGVAQKFAEGWQQWANSLSLDSVKRDLNFRVTYLLLVKEETETIDQAFRVMKHFGEKDDYLIVKVKARSGAMSPWDRDQSAPVRALAEDVGARVIEFEEFLSQLAIAMKPPGESAPLPTLRSIAQAPNLKYSEKNRAMSDWARVLEKLDSVSDVLVPPACR